MARPVENPPNPYLTHHVEWLGEPPAARLEVFEERARSCLTENDSPDIPFRFGLNPYRGCQHACAYCYARTTHQFLGFGAGTDFEKKIVVKVNAPELLERELGRPRWTGEPVNISGVTDPYQPLEASYELTRRCLAVLVRHENPFTIVTKSALVRRDVDLLRRLIERTGQPDAATVFLSVPFLDPETARLLEPGAPTPARRLEAMRALADAGIPVGVSVAPLIPGINDREVPSVLRAARDAGAGAAFTVLLRLPGEVEGVFRSRLREALPGRAAKVFSQLRSMHGGRLTDARFGRRMQGGGPLWKSTHDLFALHCRRLGLRFGEATSLETMPPGRSRRATQGSLFSMEPPH